jgi:hypothetical protein
MRRTTVFVSLLLALAALALGVRWALNTSSASPNGSMSCSVKPVCGVGEVEVFRMSAATNAHAGTPAGSAYGHVLCCGGVHNLSTDCSAVYDVALTLSGTDNAHVAADGSYAAPVCLSVPHGVADCTYGPSCGTDYQCLATVSGSSNAHVADCDGVDDYATKVCCYVEDDNDDDGTLDPADADDDNDEFDDAVEAYIGTDPWDDCPDVTGTAGLCPGPTCDGHDAWPFDNNVDTKSNVMDVLNYKGHLQICLPDPDYVQRLDINADECVNVMDILLYKGHLQVQCTNP